MEAPPEHQTLWDRSPQRRVLLDVFSQAHYFGHKSLNYVNEETTTAVEQSKPGVYSISWGAVNGTLESVSARSTLGTVKRRA